MNYKEVKMLEAVNLVMTGQEVYMLQRITSDTTIEALNGAKGFVLKTAEAPVKKAAQKEKNETPQKEKPQADEANKAIDHGKIVALYTATHPPLCHLDCRRDGMLRTDCHQPPEEGRRIQSERREE